MDGDFLASFKASAMQYAAPQSVFFALSKVLAHSTSISALRVRVSESTGPNSAWSRTNILRVDGIPIARALVHSLPSSLQLRSLKTIELDGFSGVAPLLRAAPNLETLRVSQPSGFAQYTNSEFVDALSFVPRLKELVYTPESLRVTSTWGEVQAAVFVDNEEETAEVAIAEVDYSAELLGEIGKALPVLESLSLQVRWHGDEMVFPASEASMTCQALLEAGKHLSALKHLSLPTSVFDPKLYAILRSTPSNAEIAISRAAILSEIPTIERSCASDLGLICQHLETLSFVRPASATERYDASVTYSLLVTAEHTLYMGRNATPIVRSAQVEVAPTSLIQGAAIGQVDALSRSEAGKTFGAMLTHWKRGVSDLSRHPLAGVVAAVGGGIVLGEAGRILFSHVVLV